jgi:hypothetical protein
MKVFIVVEQDLGEVLVEVFDSKEKAEHCIATHCIERKSEILEQNLNQALDWR